MNIFCRLIVLVWGLFSVNVFAFTYYVDGNIASSGIGTSVGTAFKTIQEAAIVAIAGDTCLIKSGVYRETIIPSNSGTPGNPIVFMPFNGSETVTISGADTLSGWTIYQSAIYQAPQAWTMGRGLDQVFMDGKVVIAARHPNSTTTSDGDYVLPLHLDLSPLWPKFGPFKVNKDTIRSITNNVDLNQSAPDYWKGGIYLGYNWWSWAMQSADIASSQPGKISIAMGTRRWWFAGNSYNAGSTVQFGYITNHLNALDTSGEWHWQNNTLYLWSPDNGTPAHHRVEAKKRYLAFDLRGRDNITLKGLRIFAASVNIFNSNNCIIDGCTL